MLGTRIGISEEETLFRVAKLREAGIIRRIGASINSRGLGFVSTLVTARVPAERLDDFVALINSFPGVTHNYLRKHDYNVWFTLIARSEEEKMGITAHRVDEGAHAHHRGKGRRAPGRLPAARGAAARGAEW